MLRRVDRRHLDRRHYSWSGRIQEDHSRYHRAAARNDALTRRNLKCVQELSPVNARGTLICKMNISDSPLSLPFPGLSSLTWTAGENRAVLFLRVSCWVGMPGNSEAPLIRNDGRLIQTEQY